MKNQNNYCSTMLRLTAYITLPTTLVSSMQLFSSTDMATTTAGATYSKLRSSHAQQFQRQVQDHQEPSMNNVFLHLLDQNVLPTMDGMSMSYSTMPSELPSDVPSTNIVSDSPSFVPSDLIIIFKSDEPTVGATGMPSSAVPVANTSIPTTAPATSVPTILPTVPEPASPQCPKLSVDERIALIMSKIDSVVDNPAVNRDLTTSQGAATQWIIDTDTYGPLCPDDPKFIQRWTLAVMYFASNGDKWFQCASNITLSTMNPTDDCGADAPFVNQNRFLSPVNECLWAGIRCINGCVTEYEFGTFR